MFTNSIFDGFICFSINCVLQVLILVKFEKHCESIEK